MKLRPIFRKRAFIRALRDWFEDRELIFTGIYLAARDVTMAPRVGNRFTSNGSYVFAGGERLNYETVASMMKLDQEIQTDIWNLVLALRESLVRLQDWEKENPVPEYHSRWWWAR